MANQEVIWGEGFEVDKTAAALSLKYISTTLNMTFAPGRLFPTRTSAKATTAFSSLRIPVQGDHRHWTCGVAGFISGMEDDMKLIRTLKNGVDQCRLSLRDDGSGTGFIPEIRSGSGAGTLLWAAGASFPYGFWYYFEFQVDHQSTSTGAVSLRVNEFPLVTLTNVITAPDGTAENIAFDFEERTAGGGDVRIDDIYIKADPTTAQTFLGDQQIGSKSPIGDFQAQWSRSSGSDNYLLVDDPDQNDGDSTFVFINADNLEDLYDFSAVDNISADVTCVIQHTDFRLASSGARNLQHRIESGGSKASGGIIVASDTSYARGTTVLMNNPVTAAPWSVAEVDAAHFGFLSSP